MTVLAGIGMIDGTRVLASSVSKNSAASTSGWAITWEMPKVPVGLEEAAAAYPCMTHKLKCLLSPTMAAWMACLTC